jgi:hypothetical protein
MSMRATVRLFLIPLLLLVAFPLGVAGQGAHVTERFTEPLVLNVISPCTGEAVQLTGEATITLQSTFDAAGGLHFKYTFVPSKVRGIGEDDTVFKAVGGEREHTNFNSSGAFNDTFTSAFTLISQGGGANFVENVTFHVTVDANGNVATESEHFSSECRG